VGIDGIPDFVMTRISERRLDALLVQGCVLIGLYSSLAGCAERTEAPNQPPARRLLLATSFEQDGLPSFDGWYTTQFVDLFTRIVPPGGGSWGLQFYPGIAPQEGFVATEFTGLRGTGEIEFAGWIRVDASIWPGRVSIIRVRNGLAVRVKSADLRSDEWSRFRIAGTLDLAETDTVLVKVSASSVEPSFAVVNLDSVSVSGIGFDEQ